MSVALRGRTAPIQGWLKEEHRSGDVRLWERADADLFVPEHDQDDVALEPMVDQAVISLPCGHAFLVSTIRGLVAASPNRRIKCPLCRTLVSIPDRFVAPARRAQRPARMDTPPPTPPSPSGSHAWPQDRRRARIPVRRRRAPTTETERRSARRLAQAQRTPLPNDEQPASLPFPRLWHDEALLANASNPEQLDEFMLTEPLFDNGRDALETLVASLCRDAPFWSEQNRGRTLPYMDALWNRVVELGVQDRVLNPAYRSAAPLMVASERACLHAVVWLVARGESFGASLPAAIQAVERSQGPDSHLVAALLRSYNTRARRMARGLGISVLGIGADVAQS